MSDELLTATAAAPLPIGTKIVVTAFTVSGVTHLVRPQVFRSLMPRWLGDPKPWVYASGVAELVCAAGLLTRQRWAPAATVATLSVIWVGNVQMAVNLQSSAKVGSAAKVAGWLRLPLQAPLIHWAWNSPRTSRPCSPPSPPDAPSQQR